jgi:hypothetical protein
MCDCAIPTWFALNLSERMNLGMQLGHAWPGFRTLFEGFSGEQNACKGKVNQKKVMMQHCLDYASLLS